MNRRTALRLAGAGLATTVGGHQLAARAGTAELPPGLALGRGRTHDHGPAMPTERPADAGTRPALEKFSLPLPILPDAVPVVSSRGLEVFESRIREVRAEIFPGHPTSVYGYFGSWVPPVVRARRGRRTIVRQRNETDVPVSVHLHGGVNREVFDGRMSHPVPPGGGFAYVYDNDQPASTLWLHDHTHHTDAENVYRGMSSPYLVTSDEEEALGLPSGEFEVPLVLRDADVGSDGGLVFTMDDTEHRSTILVNGTPWPRMEVRRRKYRFRVINSSAMRFFVLGLSDGTPMTQIGADASLLESPVPAPVVLLSPGERADLVVDFSQWPTGTDVDVVNYTGPGPMEDVGQVMRFSVGADASDDSVVPDRLTTLPAVPPASVERHVTMRMSEPGTTPMMATIDDRSFDMSRVDTRVDFGTTEEWTVTNESATIPHNFHCHLAHMRVLDRSTGPAAPNELGLKDTVAIFPGESVRVRMTFDRHRGLYPYHCHMLDHGAMGMMAQLRVV